MATGASVRELAALELERQLIAGPRWYGRPGWNLARPRAGRDVRIWLDDVVFPLVRELVPELALGAPNTRSRRGRRP